MPRRLLVVPAALLALAIWTLVPAGALASEGCSNEALREAQQSALPDCRAYELVSPPDKSGGDVMIAAGRTRSALDGNAVGFSSLRGFGDVIGGGRSFDYMAERSESPDPGSSGWSTHALTPPQDTDSVRALGAGIEPLYLGAFSADLDRGVFFAVNTVGSAAYVDGVPNLYRRSDLRTPGSGHYELVTACPLCETTNTPLPALPDTPLKSHWFITRLAGASADFEHIAFESPLNLTEEAPAQSAFCGTENPFFPPSPPFCRSRLYEWDHGTLRLAGILPNGEAADVSVAGHGARNDWLTLHTVSDGSDGHSRVFFTQPTNQSGETSSEQSGFGEFFVDITSSGKLFVRTDHTTTAELNASERTIGEDAYSPAEFLDATPDGTRAYFMTKQALTDDARTDGSEKIYMYDTTKPPSASDNLTLLTKPDPGMGADAQGIAGTSTDGKYVYMIVSGQLVSGEPSNGPRILLWHDGKISQVAPVFPGDTLAEDFTSGGAWMLEVRQSRVAPDGRHVLFVDLYGPGLPDYDPSSCGPFGCREVYVYNAGTGKVTCASCNPSGAAPTGPAGVMTIGEVGTTWHETHALSDDGRYVFFTSPEALVSQDVNGKRDAYVYDTQTEKVSLLSSGTSAADSVFMDASADGRDVFFLTRSQLVGWDSDDAYDLYDARVEGGFPEPPPASVSCKGQGCRGALSVASPPPLDASEGFRGDGNVKKVARTKRATACKKGRVKARVRGKLKCVKSKRRRHRIRSAHHAGAAHGGRS